jgi:hypothetical protein
VTLHSGAGRLLGYLVSHNESTAQAVTFYDSASASGQVLHRVYVPAERCPALVRFGAGPGESINFSNGLTVDPGNCEVTVWSVG